MSLSEVLLLAVGGGKTEQAPKFLRGCETLPIFLFSFWKIFK